MSKTPKTDVSATFEVDGSTYRFHSLPKLAETRPEVTSLPVSLRILLENVLRNGAGEEAVEAILSWDPSRSQQNEISYTPARVLLQDFTGVPAVVDLAAMRDAMAALGGDSASINPACPVDLVIDHSVQVDRFGSPEAQEVNARIEFQRNRERYAFLKWGQGAFRNFRVVPPDTGIVHQVNLEYLARVVFLTDGVAYFDSLVGTDSHTTMVNGLGVLGWGVGGIEAEAAMLSQPITMLVPDVVGFELVGALGEGATATDLVLTATQMLRKLGVVGKFVEYFGDGLASLSLADRATLANMSPEYGATMGFFPPDQKTLDYLRLTGRPEEQLALIEAYLKEQGVFNPDSDRRFSARLKLDLSTVEASLAGPRQPQARIALADMGAAFSRSFPDLDPVDALVEVGGKSGRMAHGACVIAAITSCTNTSNPSVLIQAGLLAKKARERGLTASPWVKTSLAPGSKVVTDYLQAANLLEPLAALGFDIVGYGCTTCIGNSGPLPESVAAAVRDHDLTAAAVLSGNRNFEGRIHALTKANYLASPALVVAFAIAGRMNVDLTSDPIGTGSDGEPVYLKEIWPSRTEVETLLGTSVKREQFIERYQNLEPSEAWKELSTTEESRFGWSDASTYIRNPPFFEGMDIDPVPPEDITGARVLALLGDTVTTDHISPAGAIPEHGPAGKYLTGLDVSVTDFNSFGSRRGNHEVMMRGTLANIRLKNLLAPGTVGGLTRHLPDGEQMSIYDAAMKYRDEAVPVIILAGSAYGTGSSRDWAAKGVMLLGVQAVIAKSYERIHRSNLIGMGVLPLEFEEGEDAASLGLTGEETFVIRGIAENLTTRKKIEVVATGMGKEISFGALARLDTPLELEYYRHGGILRYVLRDLKKRS